MARISTYVIDGTIVDDDKVIGSDANNSMITKNYTVRDLAAYIGYSIGNNYFVPYNNASQNVDLGTYNLTANSIIVDNQLVLNGTAGLPGQVLISNGSGSPASWGYNIGSQTLRDVLIQGNTGDKNLILSNVTSSSITLDLDKVYNTSVGIRLFDSGLNNTSTLLSNKLNLQDSSLQKTASYSASGIRYSSNGFDVFVNANSYANQTLLYPSNSGVLVTSVNGTSADITGNITIPIGTGTVTGVTASTPLASSGGTAPNITIQQASGSQDGYLSSGDWTTFNSKEPAIAAGTTSQYWRGDKTWQTFPTIPTVGTWGALNYPTWVSGTPFVKMTTVGTFALDTTTYQPLLTNPVTGTGTATRVAFWDTGSSISSDADLYWDNSAKRLGIGTTTPAYKLDVNGEINTNNGIRIGANGAKTGFYEGANIIDFWAGNNKISTWGLAGAGGTYYDNYPNFSYNTGDSGNTTIFKIRGTVTSNSANAAGLTQLGISPVYTQQTFGTGTLRGVYYNPQINSLNGSTHIAFENTSGDIIHGNLAGGGTQMVTVDNTGKLGTTSIPSGGVTAVTATAPLTSSGGTTPVISTSMATNKLIGRTTAGTGVMEEITVGTGLSLSSGTLNSTVTGILKGTASGTDTYTTTISGVSSYTDGDAYLIRFTNGNTTGCTLDINGLGARTLYRNNDGTLIGGDITAGGEMFCIYNSTLSGFQLIGTAPNTLLGYVTNADSVTITKGQVVYAFGGQGDRMTVKLASNTADATSARTVGVVLSTSIATNQKGLIMMQGLLDGLNILPTATWSDGDSVYLGATAGSITKVKPYAPNHLVYVATVTTASNGSAGRMYVNIQNGYELDELHNVQAQNPALKDTLWYDNTVSPAQWKTASISTILGYTPQVQLNGTGFVKASGTTISYDNSTYLTSVGTGVTNEITYWSGTNTIGSLTTATYPSLTELSYVKGVTSAIQTQLDSKGYILSFTSTAGNLLSGTTYYFGSFGRANVTTADVSRVYIPKTGIIKKAYITQGANTTGTTVSISVFIRLNNTTDTLVATSTANSTFRIFNNNALSISVTEGEYIELKVTNTSATAPTSVVFGGTIYIE